ncbi:M24 family metallopeptidase, partial [Burkholderia gladioli]|nr:M24 family metallopeptidase [Burkholderia gladioli]
AMCLGISLVRPGAKVQDIARRVQAYVESFGFSMLRVPSGTGHSIGQVHADGWLIPYYDWSASGTRALKGRIAVLPAAARAAAGSMPSAPAAADAASRWRRIGENSE